jgi:hypothetical protein
MGKSRVSPTKQLTVPRLELTAAVTACNLYSLVKSELTYPITSVTFWTDSTIVIGYVNNQSKRFKTFVANRISTIHEISKPEQWRYVPTKENPADLASRGMNPANERSVQMWLSGPKYLREGEESWPEMPRPPDIREDDSEVKQTPDFV